MNNPFDTNQLSRDQVLITLGATAVFLWLVAAIAIFGFHFQMISMRWNFPEAMLGLGLGAAVSLGSLSLYRSVSWFEQAAEGNLMMIVKPMEFQDLIWLGVLPGLSEELLFRGVILPEIGLNWWGIGVSSAIFGVLHLANPRNFAYVFWAMFVGLSFGWVTAETENLLAAVIAHVTTNILSGWIWKQYFLQNRSG